MIIDTDDFWDLKTTAKALGYMPGTLSTMTGSRVGPPVTHILGRRMYRITDVEGWAERNSRELSYPEN